MCDCACSPHGCVGDWAGHPVTGMSLPPLTPTFMVTNLQMCNFKCRLLKKEFILCVYEQRQKGEQNQSEDLMARTEI